MADASTPDTATLDDDQLIELGLELKKAREACEFSAAHVCETVLGYSHGSHVAVTRLERGLIAQPKLSILKRLCDAYGISLGQLHPSLDAATNLSSQEASAGDIASLPVPAKVKRCRRELQLSVEAFAKAVSGNGALVLCSDVITWESGEKEPNPTQLSALARTWAPLEGKGVKAAPVSRPLSAFESYRAKDSAPA